jgi:hypothetical protein
MRERRGLCLASTSTQDKPALVSPTDTSRRSDKTPVLIHRSRTPCKQGSLSISRCFTLAACADSTTHQEPDIASGGRVFNCLSLLGHACPLGGCDHLNLQSAFRPHELFFSRQEKAVDPTHAPDKDSPFLPMRGNAGDSWLGVLNHRPDW